MSKKSYEELNSLQRKIVKRTSIVNMVVSFVLVVVGLTLGIVFRNMGVISDALHTLADIGASMLIIIAVLVSNPKADKNHNYGHEKRQPIIVIFFSLLLMGLATWLAYEGITGIISPTDVDGALTVEFWLLVGIVGLSFISKEAMFWYQIYYAKKYKSDLLKANAWHSRTDSLSSIAVLIGIITGFFIGNNIVESIAVIIVAVLIAWIAVRILIKSLTELTDKAVDEKTVLEIRQHIESVENVIRIDELKTRMFGSAVYVDVEIAVEDTLTVVQGHDIAEAVHDKLEGLEDLEIKHANVHVNPAGIEKKEIV